MIFLIMGLPSGHNYGKRTILLLCELISKIVDLQLDSVDETNKFLYKKLLDDFYKNEKYVTHELCQQVIDTVNQGQENVTTIYMFYSFFPQFFSYLFLLFFKSFQNCPYCRKYVL